MSFANDLSDSVNSPWRRRRFADLVTIKHGFAFLGKHISDKPPGGVLLTPGNFRIGGGFKAEKLKFYDGPIPDDYVLPPGTLIVTMTDLSKNLDTLGYPAWSPAFDDAVALHNQRLGLVEPVHTGVDPGFVYYVMCGSDYRNEIIAGASGTTVHHTSPNRILAFEFDLPPIQEQREIAATLGALDDKIESNRRAISLIQQLSRASYVAWHDVITGLRRTTFGEFANVFGGATPKAAEPSYWNGGIAWVTPTDITALGAPYLFRTARTISQGGLGSTSATLHPPGTIFMTSRATIGAFAVAQLPAATNQGFIAVRPRMPEHRWFLFEEMRSRVPEMLDRANGSTFMELSRGNFKVMPLDVPSDGALRDLNAQLAPLHARAAQLGQENTRLADVRDALLPELLSGRIRVPEAREAVEEAVG